MNATTATVEVARRRSATYRWVRQIHLWIGAWGALAAVVYGFSGLVMNHRFGEDAWPQGNSDERGRVVLALPPTARQTPQALVAWLQQQHQLQAQVVRKAPPGTARLDGREVPQPAKWTLAGGSARASWSLEYMPGNATAEVKRSRHTWLAAINRLHKGYGGWVWTLLADSFALGMLLLGMSGLWMWARGRNPWQMVASVFGGSLLVLVIVLSSALGS